MKNLFKKKASEKVEGIGSDLEKASKDAMDGNPNTTKELFSNAQESAADAKSKIDGARNLADKAKG